MKLIVGLGNPQDKYANTRHNLGFEVIDEYARKKLEPGIIWQKEEKFKAEVIKIEKNLLIKPQTYMNNSGMAISLISNYFKIQPEDIIIIHDELDLPLGQIKIRLGGAAAGHHGVESIISALNTDKFIRIRLGIGNLKTKLSERGREHISAEKFVLEPFMHGEKAQVKHMIKKALKALDLLLEKGLEKAQNQFN